jgi:hypothetical protein
LINEIFFLQQFKHGQVDRGTSIFMVSRFDCALLSSLKVPSSENCPSFVNPAVGLAIGALGAVTRFKGGCRMVQHPETFSTHPDVAVTSMIFTHDHLKANLRLLRSTGCVARILVPLERGHRIDASFMSVINDTGAELPFGDIDVFARRVD